MDLEGEFNKKKRNGNIVICNDICYDPNLPDEFNRCDLFYSELARHQSYKTYLERAGKPNSSIYNEYISSLNSIIKKHRSSKSIWLVIGPHMIDKIIKPDRKLSIALHGRSLHLCGWNDSYSYRCFTTAYEFIALLAKRFKCVGDFCCGYGNTGRIFSSYGKYFVMSDLNPKCVYYIANTLLGDDT
jgi:hypothetical protein